ncbi:MAG: sigma-70 family RNA polymerase sigma factor [Ruminococcaceae bacterium]|nr:sigma-70 family RNA polymerase sigma factor [Oscillospiraceae bacterium]
MKSTEQRFVKRLKNGDTIALGKIIDLCSGYVCTVIRNFSRGMLSEQDIDELCADVFFNLWEHRETLDSEIPLKAYLSAIARNAVKNRFRSQKPAEDISELEIADMFSVEERAELNEIMKALDDALKQLKKREREIFLRFYFYGEKSSEIAEETGITESSVRSQLSRTRTKLKDYLTKRGFDYV